MTAEGYIRRVLAHVRGLADDGRLDPQSRVVLHFQPDLYLADGTSVISGIASSGQYLSQFATGVSNGGLTAHSGGARFAWEQRMFAHVYDSLPVEARPKYGAVCLDGDPYGAAARFGSCHFRLRQRVVARCTFCYPDSVFQPARFATADRFGLAEITHSPSGDPLDQYVEAHVHGAVTILHDVEALVLDPSYRGTDIEAVAGSIGCPVEWHPGYRLGVAAFRQHSEYRGEAVVRLAQRIAEDQELTPHLIGRARKAGAHDPQQLKMVWHYLARFGRYPDRSGSPEQT